MTILTGNCLCGQVSFEADGDITMMGNCHCTDCQQITGAGFATLVFMNENNVKISGETKRFEHTVDSGNALTKDFCPNCGSQMFGGNVLRPGSIALRLGSINEKEHVNPQFNVFCSSKAPCSILDESIPGFEKMPVKAEAKLG
ncbi:MAG: GFA family protein [Hellea sp.]|nr:GFA family protein [Hellea sp.]